jgi:hypothetical protein
MINNWWLQFIRPRAIAHRVPTKTLECQSCGSDENVYKILITHSDGVQGAAFLCDICIDAIKGVV